MVLTQVPTVSGLCKYVQVNMAKCRKKAEKNGGLSVRAATSCGLPVAEDTRLPGSLTSDEGRIARQGAAISLVAVLGRGIPNSFRLLEWSYFIITPENF